VSLLAQVCRGPAEPSGSREGLTSGLSRDEAGNGPLAHIQGILPYQEPSFLLKSQVAERGPAWLVERAALGSLDQLWSTAPANSWVPWMPQPVSSSQGAAQPGSLILDLDIEGLREAGPRRGGGSKGVS